MSVFRQGPASDEASRARYFVRHVQDISFDRSGVPSPQPFQQVSQFQELVRTQHRAPARSAQERVRRGQIRPRARQKPVAVLRVAAAQMLSFVRNDSEPCPPQRMKGMRDDRVRPCLGGRLTCIC